MLKYWGKVGSLFVWKMKLVSAVSVLAGIFVAIAECTEIEGVTENVIIIHDSEDIRPRLFNKKYLKNEDQLWVLSEENGIWGLVFKEFSVEPSKNCRHDYLQISEISKNKSDPVPPPSRYCGETVPLPYISKHARLEVRFITDSLWELNGFWIQAIHARNENLLKDKMERFSKRRVQTLALKSSGTDSSLEESPDVLSHNGPVYYILIGSAAAALVVFAGLLTYFVIAMRRQPKPPTEVPDLFYLNDVTKNGTRSSTRSDAQLANDGGPRVGSFPMRPNGRKYSRDRTEKKPDISESTFQKTIALEGQCRHNNIYIAPLRKT